MKEVGLQLVENLQDHLVLILPVLELILFHSKLCV